MLFFPVEIHLLCSLIRVQIANHLQTHGIPSLNPRFFLKLQIFGRVHHLCLYFSQSWWAPSLLSPFCLSALLRISNYKVCGSNDPTPMVLKKGPNFVWPEFVCSLPYCSESIMHLLVYCDFGQSFWEKFLSWFKYQWYSQMILSFCWICFSWAIQSRMRNDFVDLHHQSLLLAHMERMESS